MPCILKREDEDIWFNEDILGEELLDILRPYPDDEMKSWSISSLVDSVKDNFPEILNVAKI